MGQDENIPDWAGDPEARREEADRRITEIIHGLDCVENHINILLDKTELWGTDGPICQDETAALSAINKLIKVTKWSYQERLENDIEDCELYDEIIWMHEELVEDESGLDIFSIDEITRDDG